MGRRPGGVIEKIEATLIERLNAGFYPQGHAIPGAVHLAQEFGCSYQTIDRILRNLDAQNYVKRHRGSGTYPTRRQYRIAYLKNISSNTPSLHRLIPDIYNQAASEALSASGCIVKEFTYSQLLDRRFSPQLLRNFDGILCSSSFADVKSCNLIAGTGLPVVFFGATRPIFHFNCVIADWQSGLHDMFSKIEHPENRSYWIWDRSFLNSTTNTKVYKASHVAQEVQKAATVFHIPEGNMHFQPIFLQLAQSTELEAYKQCMRLNAPADVIHIATSDLLAFGLYDAFLERGYSVGDFNLISCDDLESRGISPYSEPAITSINHPKEQMAHRAVKLLLELLASGEHSCFTIELPTTLTLRKSGLYQQDDTDT